MEVELEVMKYKADQEILRTESEEEGGRGKGVAGEFFTVRAASRHCRDQKL